MTTETVRLAGTVVGAEDSVVLGWSELNADGERQRAWWTRQGFSLERADGSTVEVVVDGHALQLVVTDKRTARWKDIESEPMCEPFRHRGPAPHRRVTVKSATVRVGDQVEMLAEVIERAFVESAQTHRAAPERTIQAVSPRLMAAGPDAASALDRALEARQPKDTKAQPRRSAMGQAPTGRSPSTGGSPAPPVGRRALRTLGALFWLAVAVGSVVLAVTRPFAPITLDLVATAVGAVATAVLFHWSRLGMPAFIGKSRLGSVAPKTKRTVVVGVLTMWLMLPSTFYGADHATLSHNNSWFTNAVWFAYVLAVTGWLWYSTRTSARIVGALVEAPEASRPLVDGEWARFDGVVEDPTPIKVAGVDAAVALTTSRKSSGDSDPDIVVDRLAVLGGFVVRTEHDAIEVIPTGSAWASQITSWAPASRADDELRAVSTELIPVGASISIAGRVQLARNGRPSLRSTGRESLVFYAGRSGADLVLSLRRKRIIRRLALGLLVASLAGIIVANVALQPRLPEWTFEMRTSDYD